MYICNFLDILLFIALIHISPTTSANEHAVDSERFFKLIDRMDQLEARESVNKREIENLRDTVKHLKDRIAELEKGQDKDEGDKDTVNKADRQDFTENGNNRGIDGIRTSQILNGSSLWDIRVNTDIMPDSNKVPKIRQRRQDEIDHVAFYAVVDTHHLKNLGANQRLEFDRIVTNIGNGYRSGLGVFISPVGGTYVFTTTLMSVNHDNTHYYIAVNGNAVANMYIHGEDSYFNSVSRTVVLQLKQGDEVSVNNMNVTEGVFGYQFSSFAGFLVYPDISSKYIVG